MELNVKHTAVFTKNYKALEDKKIRFIINQGGSRSSKTYSICQMLIVYALTKPKTVISIVRKSFPALRGSVMRDFFEIIDDLGLYDKRFHNKGENYYKFPNGSLIEFFSVDDSQKLRGRKRDILFANESNELTYDEFHQLNLRTKNKLIFDYNPSDNYSWLYTQIENDKSILIKSTFEDNPFLDEGIAEEIRNLINVDEGYYRVFALGEQANLKETIFSHYKLGEYKDSDNLIYGLDIGYNHPTALVAISNIDDVLHAKELIYSSNLTTTDLIAEMDRLQVDKTKEIYVDSARPDVIEELKRAGYYAYGANKAVKEGINAIKSFQLIVDKDSSNLIKELKNYKWKKMGDITLDEPVKLWDDAIDAMRYAVYQLYLLKQSKGFIVEFC